MKLSNLMTFNQTITLVHREAGENYADKWTCTVIPDCSWYRKEARSNNGSNISDSNLIACDIPYDASLKVSVGDYVFKGEIETDNPIELAQSIGCFRINSIDVNNRIPIAEHYHLEGK